ncbi:hypothetical protein [Spartinivicinus poritis]|uniref:Uncharacterized protein n=1 Tax=Spartinivicinus poritis TaxID=2994640 RepID=A0ABT5UD33_9GAMM|nr:hypothetical protein [Spartinivicinus sp. A2-2]MDE1464287.1 hypothetical protein [Spartinivicinus sp. A2-2]
MLVLISLFCCWLVFREFRKEKAFTNFDRGYIVVLVMLAMLFAWSPIRYWRFESFLTNLASQIANRSDVEVHCNTPVDAIFDNAATVAGHATIETGRIVLQYPLCAQLMDYLDDPHNVTKREKYSVIVYVHEVMHIRGERNEQRTECQAIQRLFRVGMLLGLPAHIAKQDAITYFKGDFQKHPYFSTACAPGASMDERLPDSTWVGMD